MAGGFLHLAALPASAATPPCAASGWNPADFGLKDHTIFVYQNYYYLASIYLASTNNEQQFAYARSTDLCTWEDLGPILTNRQPGAWDEARIWAPFVIESRGLYYMFYTGVTANFTQSIMLASSPDPANPASWQPQGMVFQPNHPGMIWPGWGAWSDARDPMVIFERNHYIMYYTGKDAGGGIVGMASAPSLNGPWQDQGATLTLPNAMPESPGVIQRNGSSYLFYNRTNDGGPEVRSAASATGPWSAPHQLLPGWAHEFWRTQHGDWMVSYLTDYDVSIRPVTWDTLATPPWPFIGEQIWRSWLPAIAARQ